MSAALVDSDGNVTQLTGRATQEDTFTAEDAKDEEKVARAINDLRVAKAERARDWRPRSVTYRDIVVDNTGATKYRFPHAFAGRVVWWPVDWTGSGGSGGAWLERHTDSTDDELVLISYVDGTVSVRVEEAG